MLKSHTHGFHDYHQGVEHNPYIEGTVNHRFWESGWLNAEWAEESDAFDFIEESRDEEEEWEADYVDWEAEPIELDPADRETDDAEQGADYSDFEPDRSEDIPSETIDFLRGS